VRKTILRASLLLACTVSAVAQTRAPAQRQFSDVSIEVRDELGAVIGKTYVMLRSDALERNNPTPFSLEIRTNSEGQAKVTLPPGFYDVFVASTGFAPHCEKLRARDGKSVSLKTVLKLDKLMASEYGDQI
jgi:hypothetical protein